MTELIVVLVLIFLLPALFAAFYRFRVREERRIVQGKDLKIRYTKVFFVLFLTFGCLWLAAMIGVLIGYLLDDSMQKNTFYLLEGIFLLFALLGWLGVYAFLDDVVVVAGEEIFVKKPFRKIRKTSFDKIAFFLVQATALGGVVCYDKAGVVIFFVSQMQVGVDAFARMLAERGKEFIPVPFPEERFRQFPRYNLYKQKQKAMSAFVSFFVCGIVLLLIPLITFPLLSEQEYSDRTAEGYVEDFQLKGDNFTLSLQGDEHVYWLNNIVYENLDKTFLDKLAKGIYVRLHIGYTDERGRENITGIEYFGREYLTPQEAERAEYENYRLGRTMGFIFLGICGILLVASVPFGVRWKRLSEAFRATEE